MPKRRKHPRRTRRKRSRKVSHKVNPHQKLLRVLRGKYRETQRSDAEFRAAYHALRITG